ncbi:MAG TPA: NUDIX domain-containing protein, partial [Chitinophagaceae bacterium]|nr:NUDIX domain-containing protein [Chitinophagaceae bacterium]
LYRSADAEPEVFLVHPGGPFWKNKDEGAWTIPKGEFEESEDPLAAVIREFKEETGFCIKGAFKSLGPIQQKAGKVVHAWAVEGNIDEKKIKSNFFELEWPPRSGKKQFFPEVDKASWFSLSAAREKINLSQAQFLDQLLTMI